jgi:mono/diheme cytochrome c family protein
MLASNRCMVLAMALAVFIAPAIGADLNAQQQRGKQLVASGGCDDCHTPLRMGAKGPERDASKRLSGHPESIVLPPPPALTDAWNNAGSTSGTAFAGPWGISYAINLTPDPDTGIGKWREQDFVGAIRKGKHLGVGRDILPPMPWEAYRHLSDAELKAMFAYLKTLAPQRNRVPDPKPPAK